VPLVGGYRGDKRPECIETTTKEEMAIREKSKCEPRPSPQEINKERTGGAAAAMAKYMRRTSQKLKERVRKRNGVFRYCDNTLSTTLVIYYQRLASRAEII
jgi:hypothetical protein